MGELLNYIEEMCQDDLEKIVISKPKKAIEEFKKIVVVQKKDFFQIEKYTKTQVFHENIAGKDLSSKLNELIESHFLQVNAFGERGEHMIMISKKGNPAYKLKAGSKENSKENQKKGMEHNRKKKYLLEEGKVIAPLVDMGIFTKEGKVVKSMYDKYRQINRMLELIDDAISHSNLQEMNVIDFGCGKSYLTFILYHYLHEIKKIKTRMIGLDLKEEVIKNCNLAAKRYGYEHLEFFLGDINGFQAPFSVDMVITLHACDTATDYALYNAVQWGAKMIFSVPCCQHELNQQLNTQNFGILSKYGIVKERFAALATDAIRANLLEYSGYRTQLLEFIDFEHTPKNMMIRAVRRAITPKIVVESSRREVENLMKEFHFSPTLYSLLVKKER